MKSVVMFAILMTACATTGTPTLDREAHAGFPAQLGLVPHPDVARAFPAAIDPRLPSADRVARRIRAELGELASIEVKLCVAPQGKVSSLEVLQGSSFSVFDQSVIADAMSWQFAAMPGPDSVRTCERVTITYRPHA